MIWFNQVQRAQAQTSQTERGYHELGPGSRQLEAGERQDARTVGKLTNDDLDVIEGRREQLIGALQERYGWARNEAEKQADSFVKSLKESKAASSR